MNFTTLSKVYSPEQLAAFPVGISVISRCGYKRGVVVGHSRRFGVAVQWGGYSYVSDCDPYNLKIWGGEVLK